MTSLNERVSRVRALKELTLRRNLDLRARPNTQADFQIAGKQQVEFTSSHSGSDLEIPHRLGVVPETVVLGVPSNDVRIYRGAKEWTRTAVYLRSTAACKVDVTPIAPDFPRNVFDGSTAIPASSGGGVPIGANPTASVGLSVVNGVATTFMRSDAAPPLSQSIAPTMTGPWAFLMSLGSSIPVKIRANVATTVNQFEITNQSQSQTRYALDALGRTRQLETTTPTHVLNTGHHYTKQAPSGRTELYYFDSDGVSAGVETQITNNGSINVSAANFANPTASIGLSVVNGAATTAMRSDAAPPLSQAIEPTMTGAWIYQPSANNKIPISIVPHATQTVDLWNTEDPSGSDNVAINNEGILRLRDVGGLGGSYGGQAAPFGGLNDYGVGFSYGILFGLFSSASSLTEVCWNNESGSVVEITRAGRVNVDQFYDYNWQVQQTFSAGLESSDIIVDNLRAQDTSVITVDGDNLFVDSGHIRVEMGASGDVFYVGGVFSDHFSDAGNTTTTETTLYSTSVIGTVLGTAGDKLSAYFAGITLGSATATTQLRVYFFDTVIWDSTAIGFTSNADWSVYVEIIVENAGSGNVRCVTTCETTTAMAGLPYVQYTRLTGLNLSNTTTLKITGQRAGTGAATNDIVAKLGSVKYYQANA